MQVFAITFNKKNLPPRCIDEMKIEKDTVLEASCKINGISSKRFEFLLFVTNNIFNINADFFDLIAVVKRRQIP